MWEIWSSISKTTNKAREKLRNSPQFLAAISREASDGSLSTGTHGPPGQPPIGVAPEAQTVSARRPGPNPWAEATILHKILHHRRPTSTSRTGRSR